MLELESGIPEEQARTKVYRHPDRETIHTLIKAGKSPAFIAKWLSVRYPVEDEMGVPDDNAESNRRWQLQATTIGRYKGRFMAQHAEQIDVIDPMLAEALGPRLPAADAMGSQFELQVLEAVVNAGMTSLGRSMASDKEMEMTQGVTLEAQKTLIEAVRARVEIASLLGLPSYEKAPDVQVQKIDQTIKSTNRNLNVDLYGGHPGQDGAPAQREPAKVSLLRELMEKSPEQTREILATAEGVVEAEAIEEDEDEWDADEHDSTDS